MDTIHNPSLNIVHYGLINMHSISVFDAFPLFFDALVFFS